MNHQILTVPQVIPQVAYPSLQAPTQLMTESPVVDSGFAVPVFSPGDDPIACLNKAMAFLIVVASSRFPTTNNQLRTSSNPRNQATIQDGRVTGVNKFQGRQGKLFGILVRSNVLVLGGNTTSGQARVVKCYNCQGEGRMASQEAGTIFGEEQPHFLQSRNSSSQTQMDSPHNAAFEMRILKHMILIVKISRCAQAVLMAPFHYGYQNLFYLRKAQRIKPTLYDGAVISKTHVAMPVIDDEETLILEEESRSKMFEKAKDPEVIAKKISHKPIDYEKLNSLIKDLKHYFFYNKNYRLDKPFGFISIYLPLNLLYSPPVHSDVPGGTHLEDTHICSGRKVFKDQFESIKQTRVRHKEQCDSLINKLNLKSMENEDLKAQIQDKVFVITSLKNDLRKSKGKEIVENVVHIPSATTIASGMFKLDLVPLPPRLLQNREVHINYLRNTQEQSNILQEIVEQVKEKQPLDGDLNLACKYATRIQELLVYVQDTCPNAITPSTKKVAVTPMNNVKKVRLDEPLTSSSNIKQPPGNKKNDRISQTPSRNKKNKVEAQPRKVNNMNCVVKPVCDVDVKESLSNANSDILCATCNKSMFDGVHDKCLLDLVLNGNNRAKSAKKHKKQNIWKPTGHVFTEVGFKWKPTSRTFTIVGNSCPLTRFTSTNVVHPKKTTSHSVDIQKPELKVYSRKPKNVKNIGSSKKAKIVESKNANHSEPNQTWGSNATDIPSSSSLIMTGCPDCPDCTVRFRNDQIARIMGYGAYQLGNIIILRVYYVEGHGHNLFSVGQFCDADLEVAFRKNTCFIFNLEGVDLLSGSRDTNLYTISLDDMLKSSPICLLSKASKTKSWLWHRRLSHLNFGTLNKLAKDSLARGIPRLKFQKDHLCSACALGKSKKTSHQPKAEDTNQEKLYLLHMDLCGPMRVASINGKMYMLVIVDNYSRFTWVRFLKTKDEAPATIIKCIKNIQVRLKATVQNVRTDNRTKFVNQTLRECSRPGLHYMTPATSSTGLGSNYVSQQPCLPPKRDDWDRLFQPMFDEYFNPPPIAVSLVQEAAAPRAEVLADSPVSTSIDQDASSTNHPIANVIGDPSRSVSTRKQLKTDAMWCYFDAFLTSVEPKNFKQAMTEPSWIDAMQEEIHEFERLEVWELVPCPDNVFLIKLKWIYKVKIDESGGVLKNKARLVA
ncbi:retrovirus-related pol polyprotein from transposon TNT 1-94 [Tanacetum coccineum]